MLTGQISSHALQLVHDRVRGTPLKALGAHERLKPREVREQRVVFGLQRLHLGRVRCVHRGRACRGDLRPQQLGHSGRHGGGTGAASCRGRGAQAKARRGG